MTLNEWFLKNTKIPLRVLLAFMGLIYFLFLYYAVETHRASQDKNLKDLIVGTALIGIQQNDRVLIESSLERSIENLGVKAAFLCQGDRLIFNTSSEVASCNDIPQNTFWNRRVSFTDLGFDGYELHFIAPNFVVASSHLWLLIVSFLVLLACFWIIRRLGQNLVSDIFSPMADVLLSEKNDTDIKELKDIRELITLQNIDKEKAAFEAAFKGSKDKFSHNIKSPLRNIKVLHDRFKHGLDEEENELFKSVIDEVSGITENFEIENPYNQTAATTEKKAIHDVAQVFEKSVKRKLLEWKPNQDSPKIEISADSESMPVYSDLSELRSIVSNLLNNSKDAGAEKINILLKRDCNAIEIFISDDGHGIPKKLVENIFDKDFTHGKDGGTGYGLYHAKRYLNDWGGEIFVESADNGAEFKITLPVWSYEKIEISKNDRIVILEDNLFFQKQIKNHVLYTGAVVANIKIFSKTSEFKSWYSSRQATERFVLIADNNLGKNEQTGLELIKELQEQRSDLRSCLLTDGHDESELVNRCMKSGVRLAPKSDLGYLFSMGKQHKFDLRRKIISLAREG